MEEIWKTHPRIDERYEFSNYGRFRNVDKNIILKQTVNLGKNQAYVITFLKLRNSKERKRFRIHRIVAELFVPNPNNYSIINHIDGDKLNNHYTNLEWCDDLINIRHAIDNNLRAYSHAQKLTIEDVIKIRQVYDSTNITQADLARYYNVSPLNLSYVLTYKSYGRIESDKKMTYKINYLSKEDLANWYRTKVRLKKGETLSQKFPEIFFSEKG